MAESPALSRSPEGELIDILTKIGFRDVEVRERFDTFRGTTKESVAHKFGVVGVNVFARKPDTTDFSPAAVQPNIPAKRIAKIVNVVNQTAHQK